MQLLQPRLLLLCGIWTTPLLYSPYRRELRFISQNDRIHRLTHKILSCCPACHSRRSGPPRLWCTACRQYAIRCLPKVGASAATDVTGATGLGVLGDLAAGNISVYGGIILMVPIVVSSCLGHVQWAGFRQAAMHPQVQLDPL